MSTTSGVDPNLLVPTLDGPLPIKDCNTGGNAVLCCHDSGRLEFVKIVKVHTSFEPCSLIILDKGERFYASSFQRIMLWGFIPRRIGNLREDIRLEVFSRFVYNSQGYLGLKSSIVESAILEHRLMMECIIGESLDQEKYNEYEVHHKDEHKSHNVRSNLDFLTKSGHMSYHTSGYRNPVHRIHNKIKWAAHISLALKKQKHMMPLETIISIGRAFELRFRMPLSRRNWDYIRSRDCLPIPSSGALVSKYRFSSFTEFKRLCTSGDNHRVVAIRPIGVKSVVTLELEKTLPFYLEKEKVLLESKS